MAGNAAATLDDCQLFECGQACVYVLHSTCRLTACTLSKSFGGLEVVGESSSAHASTCHLLHNGTGASARCNPITLGAILTLISCTSSGNKFSGYEAQGASVLEVTDCVSDQDTRGCHVCDGAMLRATRVAVTRSTREGYCVYLRGHAVLNECSAKACGTDGVFTCHAASKVHAEGCTFQSNGRCGVMAQHEAEATVKGRHSSQHSSAAGYRALSRAQMKVSGSVSEGDQEGCSADLKGQLTMKDVIVNGSTESGQLGEEHA